MKINRRLTLLGIMIIVLSMTMATQYATTAVTYSFGIVHPSNADIRYIGSDNSSGDNQRVLRVTNNVSGAQFVTISLGDWMPNSMKNYTAAFGIVNEEQFAVNITHLNFTGTNSSYLTIWLHGDRDADYNGETSSAVKVVDKGTALYSSSDVVWTLAAGDGDPTGMNDGESGAPDLSTPWDTTSDVMYSENDANNSVNETSDFVWIGISLDIDSDAKVQAATGTLYFNFKATTLT